MDAASGMTAHGLAAMLACAFLCERWWPTRPKCDSVCSCIQHSCTVIMHMCLYHVLIVVLAVMQAFFYLLCHSHLFNFVLKCTRYGHTVMAKIASSICKKYDAGPTCLLESTRGDTFMQYSIKFYTTNCNACNFPYFHHMQDGLLCNLCLCTAQVTALMSCNVYIGWWTHSRVCSLRLDWPVRLSSCVPGWSGFWWIWFGSKLGWVDFWLSLSLLELGRV